MLRKEDVVIGSSTLELIVKDLSAKYLLSQREAEVLKGFIEGKTYSEMTQDIYITSPAITYHAQNIFKKLKIKNRHQLVMRVIEWVEDKNFRYERDEHVASPRF